MIHSARCPLTPSYPQTEDDLFDGHNLISFDMRGHGLTAVEGLDEGFDMWSAAEDIKAGLVSAAEALVGGSSRIDGTASYSSLSLSLPRYYKLGRSSDLGGGGWAWYHIALAVPPIEIRPAASAQSTDDQSDELRSAVQI